MGNRSPPEGVHGDAPRDGPVRRSYPSLFYSFQHKPTPSCSSTSDLRVEVILATCWPLMLPPDNHWPLASLISKSQVLSPVVDGLPFTGRNAHRILGEITKNYYIISINKSNSYFSALKKKKKSVLTELCKRGSVV